MTCNETSSPTQKSGNQVANPAQQMEFCFIIATTDQLIDIRQLAKSELMKSRLNERQKH